MARREMSASGKVKKIVEAASEEPRSATEYIVADGQDGDKPPAKATLKDWAIVIGTIIVALVLLSSCMRSCRGGGKKSDASEKQAAQEEAIKEDATGEEETIDGVTKAHAEELMGSFVECYNELANLPLGTTLSSEDLSEEELDWASSKVGEAWNIIYRQESYAGAKVIVKVTSGDDGEKLSVLYMHRNNDGLLNALRAAYLTLSSDTDDGDLTPIRNRIAFSGESVVEGSLGNVEYKYEKADGICTFILTALTKNISFEPTAGKEVPFYESDDLINEFMLGYNAVSSSPVSEYSAGNHRAKIYIHSYDRQMEILHGSDSAMHVTISADYQHPEMADLREAFHDSVIVLDGSITGDEAYACFDACLNGEGTGDGKELGRLTYKYYPTVELSKSTSFGRVEIRLPLSSD